MFLLKINQIKLNPDNPRFIKDDKFKKLVKSIEEFPEMLKLRPIIIDEDNMILGGNMRFKACEHLKMKEVWVEKAENLTPEQKNEFIVKDNVGFGEWDWELLGNLFDEDQLGEWGLDIPEFEIEKHIATDDNFEVPEDGFETDIVLGDLIEIGQHRLLCGDSTKEEDVSILMDGKLADMVFTDPPWNDCVLPCRFFSRFLIVVC